VPDPIKTQLDATLRLILGLCPPTEGQGHLSIALPESLRHLGVEWREKLIAACLQELMTTFDFRRRSESDDPDEIERWKKPTVTGGWIERRKNHRLRIRTMVDDLFEKNRPLPDVLTCVRAWKLQVADACADAIMEQYHLRPAATSLWLTQRRKLHRVAQEIQEALAHKDLFLMTGRFDELKAMQTKVRRAHQAMQALTRALEENET
jgi:hypothetical protein